MEYVKRHYRLYRRAVGYMVFIGFVVISLYSVAPRRADDGRDLTSIDTKSLFEANLTEFESHSPRTVFAIMPTYSRPNQRSLLTVLAHAFHYVKDFHWIIAEDSRISTPWIRELLDRFKFNYTHIACDRVIYCARHKDCRHVSAKGSVVRNCALMWLKQSAIKDGIIYFADDDNFYDSRLFEEIRSTRRLSVFPVGGFVTTGLSGPIVKDGKIVDFIDPWKADRKFPIDMAGFAVNLKYWRRQNCPLFRHIKGYLETKFIQDLNITKDDLELAGTASQVYVWHNTIQKVKCNKKSSIWQQALKYQNTNMDALKRLVDC